MTLMKTEYGVNAYACFPLMYPSYGFSLQKLMHTGHADDTFTLGEVP